MCSICTEMSLPLRNSSSNFNYDVEPLLSSLGSSVDIVHSSDSVDDLNFGPNLHEHDSDCVNLISGTNFVDLIQLVRLFPSIE